MTKGADAVVLQVEKVFQLIIEDIAEGCQVEEMFAEFLGYYLPAVFAHLPFNMRVHVFAAFFERVHRRILLFIGVYRDAAAVGYCFDYTAVDPGSRLLILGQAVKDAAVANQNFGNHILKITDNLVVLHN